MIYEGEKCRLKYDIFYNILTLSLLLLLFFLCLSFWNINSQSIKKFIHMYNWIGVIIIVYIFYTWRRITEKTFTPYTIFFLFVALFNYGQFIMWAFGIHYKGELGTTNFVRYMDQITLLRIQMITCVYFLSFHYGSILITINLQKKKQYKKLKDDNTLYCLSLKIVVLPILVISTIVTYYLSIKSLNIATNYGYTSIYYGGFLQINPFFKYMSYMFFPSLLGLWISYKYSKKAFYVAMLIFLPYLIINMLSGDRGSWVYNIIILFWCYVNYINKPKGSSLIKFLIIGIIILMTTSIIVKFREIGLKQITKSDIFYIIRDSSYIFMKPIFEMGQSARVLGIIIQDNLDKYWSYGNTYVAGFLGILLPRVKTWFGYPDFYLDNWLSQDYLGLKNYGVGFSIFAEAYLNGGLFYSCFFVLLLGVLFGKCFYINQFDCNNPRKMFFALSSLSTFMYIARGSFELYFRMWFYGTIIIIFIVDFLVKLFKMFSAK